MRKKLEILGDKYNKTLKPITDYQMKYHKEHSAKYIFVFDKQSQAAFCQRCETNFVFNHKVSHLSKEKCPTCGKKMMIYHTWRSHNYPTANCNMVIPKALDNHTLVLRYLNASSKYDNPRIEVKEVGRMYISDDRANPEYWCCISSSWSKRKQPYFVPTVCFYTPNPRFVGDAYEYPRNFFKEINKLDCFKYYPCENVYSFSSYSMQLHYLIRSAKLNEKLSKLGINIESIHRYYYIKHNDTCFPIDYNKSDLIGMLKLDKNRFKILMECTFDFDMIKFLRNNPDIKRDEFILANYNREIYFNYKNFASLFNVSYKKIANYARQFTGMDGNSSFWEYKHYIYTLQELNYDMNDTYYTMPKDFKKADKRITEEYNRLQEERRRKENEIRLAEDSKKDELISKISKGLMELPEIKELCGNSKGLLIYVPESAKDLYEEGQKLHNCLSTYTNRVASQQTLIFYIRKLESPNEPFVAMEMSYQGVIHQIRYDHNKEVNDSKIIDFAQKVAEIVKKHSKELIIKAA